MSACSSSGVSIIITSAHLAAGGDVHDLELLGLRLFFDGPARPLRSATATFLTPEKKIAHGLRAWAWPLAAVADDGDLLAP